MTPTNKCVLSFIVKSLKRSDALFKLILVHAGKGIEGILNTFTLERRSLEEFKSNRVSKSLTILRVHSRSLVQIDLVRNHDTLKLFALVLLLDTFVPLPQQVEGVRVRHIVDQDNLIGFAQEIESNFLENVLTCDVDQVQLNRGVATLFVLDFFDLVLATLSHHVVMVEGVPQVLVNNLGLADGRFTGNDDSRAQS